MKYEQLDLWYAESLKDEKVTEKIYNKSTIKSAYKRN